MPKVSLFKIPEMILACAKSLVTVAEDRGGRPLVEERFLAARTKAEKTYAGAERGFMTPDKTFWATMAGSDRRLAELRRAIDQAAAEAIARETVAEASPNAESLLGEGRCEAANRMIAAALNAEKP